MSPPGPANVLVTGVAGFLGRYIAREFTRLGWRVVGLDAVAAENAPPAIEYHRMVLPSAELSALVSREKPAACIHCAGRASVAHSLSDPASDFRDSAALTFER